MKLSFFTLLVAISCVAARPVVDPNEAPATIQTRQIEPETLRNSPMNPSQRDFEREAIFDPVMARDSYARRHIAAAEARERLEHLRNG
jgi:hypothetical protein